jgi:hypothetical protein
LGYEAFPLDPRLADMMAKTFPVPVMVIDREEDRIHWVSPGFLEMSRANPEHLRAESARAVLERYFSSARELTDLFDYKTPMAEVKAALQSEDGTTYDILGLWMGMQLEKRLAFIYWFSKMLPRRSASKPSSKFIPRSLGSRWMSYLPCRQSGKSFYQS